MNVGFVLDSKDGMGVGDEESFLLRLMVRNEYNGGVGNNDGDGVGNNKG